MSATNWGQEAVIYIATLITAGDISTGDLSSLCDRLAQAGCGPQLSLRIDEGRAADIVFQGGPSTARKSLDGALPRTDVIVQPMANREKKLLIADMDSTMITVECLDELADYAGIKDEIAAVTERAMRGELDFAQALDERVARLKGLDASVIDKCLAERIRATPGAATLVRTMKSQLGATTLLVSGGFSHFADRVGAAIGFDRALANDLGIADGKLTGTVAKPIVDSAAKEKALLDSVAALGIPLAQTLAVGDGANDLPMIRKAGLGVAYRAKPVVAAEAAARLDHTDLTALLYAQGVPSENWERG
ncbi:phosphoserine phosphatase SerB [Hephaestia sp. MAHUQ-44]|uniref:phosphoserine phosphatase SerB n=1 Tax=Hephaestia sp. MAHUQ-44 TaxID=2952526 RepID=UPI0020773941|nr:phosphoserine phosphatase SerB [Hephaestia sp. MAHUQ-44]MCM8730026.1 phosphoserine phosphatase SerB [Hephaestia sp. MAHUQ-44]